MKIQIEESIVINANMEQVWEVLSAFHLYEEWNSVIVFYQAELQVGEKIAIRLQLARMKATVMRPTVLNLEDGKELRWKGHLGFKGVFDGEHYFLLKALDVNKTKLVHGEFFSGLLLLFLKKMIKRNTVEGFKAFNTSLKKRVEE